MHRGVRINGVSPPQRNKPKLWLVWLTLAAPWPPDGRSFSASQASEFVKPGGTEVLQVYSEGPEGEVCTLTRLWERLLRKRTAERTLASNP